MRPKGKTTRQRKRLKWLVGATKWRRVGTETMEEEILITRILRKPPSYRLEYVRDDGKVMAAMLVKSPKGTKGYDVVLDGLNGFHAPTRRKALVAFGELHKTLEKAGDSDVGRTDAGDQGSSEQGKEDGER